jgi:hypothetical protein
MIESDIEQCLALTTDRFLYREDQLPPLGRLWSRLIREKTGVPPHVITDPNSPSRVLYFATMAFVDDERADRYHDLSSPKIGYSMAEELGAGGRPFLSRADVADVTWDRKSGPAEIVGFWAKSRPREILLQETQPI